jgi:hypothetical protein
MSNLQNEKMKKKLYNTPQMNIVKINISNLLNNISAGMSTDVEDQIVDSDNFGSRLNDVNVWGDDDEE